MSATSIPAKSARPEIGPISQELGETVDELTFEELAQDTEMFHTGNLEYDQQRRIDIYVQLDRVFKLAMHQARRSANTAARYVGTDGHAAKRSQLDVEASHHIALALAAIAASGSCRRCDPPDSSHGAKPNPAARNA